jgi:hypothetical protein
MPIPSTTLSISKHSTPEYAPQFGIYPEDGSSHDIAIVRGEQAEAYARLFAAAPELLSALTMARNFYDEGRDESDPTEMKVLAAINSAIAKATH